MDTDDDEGHVLVSRRVLLELLRYLELAGLSTLAEIFRRDLLDE